MEKETVLIKVLCKDRLPEKDGEYIAGSNCIEKPFPYIYVECLLFKDGKFIEPEHWETIYWLEEVPISQIKAEAWEQGYKTALDYQVNLDNIPPINPYR